MASLLRDVRHGVRLLRKNPGFTSVAVLALAIGIAANTAIFSVVYATLLAPLPFPNPDQLVMVWSRVQDNRNGVSAGDFVEWRRQSNAFQGLNAWTGRSLNLATDELPETVQARAITPGWLSMVGYDFELFGKVGLNLDFGVLWQGEPTVTLDATGLDTAPPDVQRILELALEAERRALEDEISDYKVWPVVSLSFVYNF